MRTGVRSAGLGQPFADHTDNRWRGHACSSQVGRHTASMSTQSDRRAHSTFAMAVEIGTGLPSAALQKSEYLRGIRSRGARLDSVSKVRSNFAKWEGLELG